MQRSDRTWARSQCGHLPAPPRLGAEGDGPRKVARRRDAGFTFAELAFGLLIFVISAAVLINHLTVNYQTTLTERDRVFAYAKAQSLLAEIQNAVDRADDEGYDLDALDNGSSTVPNLTIQTDENGLLLPAAHVLSGNTQRHGGWLWTRRITVQPFPGIENRNVRYVTVRVLRRDPNGREHSVADLSSVIMSNPSTFPPTQVFDAYFLAIENIPGWWVYMDAIQPFVEAMVTDLETRNPGLSIRTHWITKAAYGRNQSYTPYINTAVDSWQPIPSVYHYPGLMPAGSASSFYYVPGNIQARMQFDGVLGGGYDAFFNPQPYALADFFNHAMREPDERALHTARVAAIEQREAEIAADIAGGVVPRQPLWDMSKEPTLRLLLEDMNTNPDLYRNAMVVNLHGELLPMPAMRNYSDAAKDPDNWPEVRVVTHPEELRTERSSGSGSDAVVLRTYAYVTDPDAYTGPEQLDTIAIEVVGMDLTDPSTAEPDLHPDVDLEVLQGGVDIGGVKDYFPFASAIWDTTPSTNPSRVQPNQMYYEAEFVAAKSGGESFTRIKLFNTPVVAPEVNTKGVYNDWACRLYDMEYVPSAPRGDFSRDLNATGTDPKNTARWRLTIGGEAFPKKLFVDNSNNRYNPNDDVQLQVRTRIWSGKDPETSGTLYPPAAINAPDNLSTTYTWWADAADAVPATERAQFFGDPRHCPYKDVLNGDPDFGDGYNWYHDQLQNSGDATTDYVGLDRNRLANRWVGRSAGDVPRMLGLLRTGLVQCGALFTTLTGFSFYYLGNGCDIGYDADNGYPNSIPVDLTPYGNPGLPWYVNTLTGNRTYVRSIDGGGNYWWGMPWLGELYPDTAAALWWALDANGEPAGNLPAGSASGQFFQGARSWIYGSSRNRSFGVRIYDSRQLLSAEGCTSFFNIGSSSSTFHHQLSSGSGNVVGAGVEVANNYNLTVPSTAPISRPFEISTSGWGGVGNEWNHAPYSTERHSARMIAEYYDHGSGSIGSGLVQLFDPAGAESAFVVVNGIDRTVQSGSSFIAQWSVLTLLHSFFECGASGLTSRILQPPRIEVDSPTDITELANPSQIKVQWSIDWTRWDELPYTTATPAGFAENEAALEYVILYSRDGGDTWLHVQDNSLATPGELPESSLYRIADQGTGPETYDWATPTGDFPESSYLLQIETYRQGQALHYSMHRTRFYLQR